MGALGFFDEVVDSMDNQAKPIKCSVDVLDNHSIPEVRIGPEGAAHKGWAAAFQDWDQFTRFVEAVNDLHSRLAGIHK